jgi:hypothetical protein
VAALRACSRVRFGAISGYHKSLPPCPLLTHSDTSRLPIAALRKVHSITSSARPARNVFDGQMQHKLSEIRGKGMRERAAKAARTWARLWPELDAKGPKDVSPRRWRFSFAHAIRVAFQSVCHAQLRRAMCSSELIGQPSSHRRNVHGALRKAYAGAVAWTARVER